MNCHLILPLLMCSSYVIYYEPLYHQYNSNYCFPFLFLLKVGLGWSESFSFCLPGSVGFPDYNSPDDWECDLSWKHWPGQMDGTSADFVKTGDHELLDFTSEGHCISKKRCAYRNWPSPTVLDHNVYLLDQVFICAGMPWKQETDSISQVHFCHQN